MFSGKKVACVDKKAAPKQEAGMYLKDFGKGRAGFTYLDKQPIVISGTM